MTRTTTSARCRKCYGVFRLPEGGADSSVPCPHCGASVAPAGAATPVAAVTVADAPVVGAAAPATPAAPATLLPPRDLSAKYLAGDRGGAGAAALSPDGARQGGGQVAVGVVMIVAGVALTMSDRNTVYYGLVMCGTANALMGGYRSLQDAQEVPTAVKVGSWTVGVVVGMVFMFIGMSR